MLSWAFFNLFLHCLSAVKSSFKKNHKRILFLAQIVSVKERVVLLLYLLTVYNSGFVKMQNAVFIYLSFTRFFQRWIMKPFGILLKKQLEVFFWVELHSLFTPMVPSLVMLSLIIKMRSLRLKKGTIHILRNHLIGGRGLWVCAGWGIKWSQFLPTFPPNAILQCCNTWILMPIVLHVFAAWLTSNVELETNFDINIGVQFFFRNPNFLKFA